MTLQYIGVEALLFANYENKAHPIYAFAHNGSIPSFVKQLTKKIETQLIRHDVYQQLLI